MENTSKLIAIGFWRSPYEPDLPHPLQFVDECWDINEKDKIAAYLEQCPIPYYWMGKSYCRFGCDDDMGSGDHTDGKYLWPEGLSHYIRKHNVRLPVEVVEHMLSVTSPIADLVIGERPNIDHNWWKAQGKEDTGHIELFPIGVFELQLFKEVDIHEAKKIITDFFNSNFVYDRYQNIDKFLKGEKIGVKGRFKKMPAFIDSCTTFGIVANFTSLTIEEYNKLPDHIFII